MINDAIKESEQKTNEENEENEEKTNNKKQK